MKKEKSKIKLYLMLLCYHLGKLFMKSVYLLAFIVFVGPMFILLSWGCSFTDFLKVISVVLIIFPFILEFYFKKKVPRSLIDEAAKEANKKIFEIKNALKQ